MAIDRRIGSKVTKSLRAEESPGVRIDPHPYIGIVKNNLDPTRSGRLQVWIPELGGTADDPNNWRTIGYSSPFMGTTSTTTRINPRPSSTNSYKNVANSYGMWMVPPDIGTEVICIFIAGNPMRGYMISCINSNLSRFMMPGLASSTDIAIDNASPDVKKSYKSGTAAPVVEYNELDPQLSQQTTFIKNPKAIHEFQYNVLKEQGLDRDSARGTITSSSQRESPSNVFGISTPGRPLINDPADRAEEYLKKLNNDQLTEDDYICTARKGGHTFVMDDGNIVGVDQLIRLRTAKGHQLMMHDTDNSLYIGHADGTSWVELASDGSIHVFSNAGINIRSKNAINFHSDTNINFHAAQNISMHAGKKTQIDTDSYVMTASTSLVGCKTFEVKTSAAFNIQSSTISLNASGGLTLVGSTINQNSGGGASVASPKVISLNGLNDTTKDSTGLYQTKSGLLQSIVTVAPCHEPFVRKAPTATADITSDSPAVEPIGTPPNTYTGKADATKKTAGTAVQHPASEKDILNQPPSDCKIGNLTPDQLTAYYAQIGKSESGGRYSAVNTIGFVGKYQFGYMALIDLKYVKRSCKSNSQLNNPNNWLGKNGVSSLQDFLSNTDAQEEAMCEYTAQNYKTMSRIGAISKDTPPEDIGGMLAVSHLLGAGGAKTWRNSGGGADQYGTTGDTYFQKGKYAVTILAPQVTASKIG